MAKYTKSRTWGMVVYPESAPENWQELLSETFMQFAVSPLHDKDINPDGEIKKPHWHVILIWDGPVTQNAAMKIAEKVNAPQPVKLESVRGAYRYFTHMDNPEKYQYNREDMIAHGGADILEMLKPTSASRYEMFKEMTSFIVENDIREYEELWIYAMENRFDDWFPLLADNGTFAINTFIKSRRHRIKDNK